MVMMQQYMTPSARQLSRKVAQRATRNGAVQLCRAATSNTTSSSFLPFAPSQTATTRRITTAAIRQEERQTPPTSSATTAGDVPSLTWVNVETRGRVGLITLNRPKALNALSDALMTDLNTALSYLQKQASIGAIILTGSERAFAGILLRFLSASRHLFSGNVLTLAICSDVLQLARISSR